MADALLGRASRILDAGCGMGRIGGELALRGHHVLGVDLDPILVDAARKDFPEVQWQLGDLSELSLPGQTFDLIVCAGNVMTFLSPGTAPIVLANFKKHLATEGRAVIGFGGDRGYAFADFFADVQDAGLCVSGRFATWHLHPFGPDSDYLVALLEHAPEPG